MSIYRSAPSRVGPGGSFLHGGVCPFHGSVFTREGEEKEVEEEVEEKGKTACGRHVTAYVSV